MGPSRTTSIGQGQSHIISLNPHVAEIDRLCHALCTGRKEVDKAARGGGGKIAPATTESQHFSWLDRRYFTSRGDVPWSH
jgi:hypothetical protein